MKLKNHLGETFELRIQKYHLELSDIEVKLFNSDWLDAEINIKTKNEIFTKFNVDDVIKGTVSRIVEYGAFIDLGDGVEGLLCEKGLIDNR